MAKIDFVIPWVDGSDREWIKEKNQYLEMEAPKRNVDGSDKRYRDWGLLKYWFRGVEKYTPWVNKIFFITYGHLPEWLNVDNKKLVIVKHEDYMPQEYLPTFSSNPIELNLHRIDGLSEHFVYFNDDFFILNHMAVTDFFQKGLPVDACIETILSSGGTSIFGHFLYNDISIINKHFVKKTVIRNNISKYFNTKYGTEILNNIYLSLWKSFTFFKYIHAPQPMLKSVIEEVWSVEGDLLDRVSRNRFRTYEDVNQYLFKFWQYCTGQFMPCKPFEGKAEVCIGEKNYLDAIKSWNYNSVCLNDTIEDIDIEPESRKIISVFEEKLSEKCSYEK